MQIRIGLPTIGGALLNGAILWQGLKWALDWRGRYDAAHNLVEVGGMFHIPPWLYLVLLVVGLLLIWWDTRRTKREFVIDISPLVAAVATTAVFVAVWAWFFYDRAQGPIIWNFDVVGSPISWSSSGGGPLYFSAFQIQASNRSDDPVTATKAFIRSNLTGTEVPLLFGGDIPIRGGTIQPKAKFALISEPGAWRNPQSKPDVAAIMKEFGSFTFVFESPQKNYSIRFDRGDLEKMVALAERDMRREPVPTVIPRPSN